MIKTNYCEYCYFSLDGHTSIYYPCNCCRLNTLFPSALKDYPNYFTTDECPRNMSKSEFALKVKKENDIRKAKTL